MKTPNSPVANPTAQTAPEGAQITPLPQFSAVHGGHWVKHTWRIHDSWRNQIILVLPFGDTDASAKLAGDIADALNQTAALTASNAELRRALEAVAHEVRAYPESPHSYSSDSYLPQKFVALILTALGGAERTEIEPPLPATANDANATPICEEELLRLGFTKSKGAYDIPLFLYSPLIADPSDGEWSQIKISPGNGSDNTCWDFRFSRRDGNFMRPIDNVCLKYGARYMGEVLALLKAVSYQPCAFTPSTRAALGKEAK